MIFIMIFIFITPLSATAECPCELNNQTEWIERYKDPNICIYTKYIENRGIYFDVFSEDGVVYELEMYDIFGRKVIEKKVEFSTNFNRNIPKGMYCLRIHKQDKVTNQLISVN